MEIVYMHTNILNRFVLYNDLRMSNTTISYGEHERIILL